MTPATNGARADRYGNPGWSIQPGSDARSVRQILTARGAVRWYTGSAVSLIWILTVVPLLTQHGAAAAILPLVLLVVFAVGFLVGAPLAWSSRARGVSCLPERCSPCRSACSPGSAGRSAGCGPTWECSWRWPWSRSD